MVQESRKVVSRNVALALGVLCIVLIAVLAGVLASGFFSNPSNEGFDNPTPEATLTASPPPQTPTTTPTLPTQNTQNALFINGMSAFSVIVTNNGNQPKTVTGATLKDGSGSIISNTGMNATLQAGQTAKLDFDTPFIATSGQTYTITITTNDGDSCTSPPFTYQAPDLQENIAIQSASITQVVAVNMGNTKVTITTLLLKDPDGNTIQTRELGTDSIEVLSGQTTTINTGFLTADLNAPSYTMTLVSSNGNRFISAPFTA